MPHIAKRDPKQFVLNMNAIPAVQLSLKDPHQVDIVQRYADALRVTYDEIPDQNIAWILTWAADFIAEAINQEGDSLNPREVIMTLMMVARELMLLHAELPDS